MIQATEKEYLRLLLDLLPPGQMARDEDSNWAKFLTPNAKEFARIDARARNLLEEKDPQTTIEAFTEHESFAGLPDECSLGDLTLGERRDALISKLKSRGGQSRAYFKSICEELGYSVDIVEFRPMGFGKWGFGANEQSDNYGRYLIGPQTPGSDFEKYWLINIYGTKFTRFAFARSAFGDPMLKIRTADQLECILNQIIPGHTNLTFNYIEEEE